MSAHSSRLERPTIDRDRRHGGSRRRTGPDSSGVLASGDGTWTHLSAPELGGQAAAGSDPQRSTWRAERGNCTSFEAMRHTPDSRTADNRDPTVPGLTLATAALSLSAFSALGALAGAALLHSRSWSCERGFDAFDNSAPRTASVFATFFGLPALAVLALAGGVAAVVRARAIDDLQTEARVITRARWARYIALLTLALVGWLLLDAIGRGGWVAQCVPAD